MNKRNAVSLLTLATVSLLLACGSDSGGAICDSSRLSSALANAASGDTVTIGSCRIADAAVTVPAGVTLAGTSRDGSVLVAAAGHTAVTLTPGSEATALVDLTIETDAVAGVVARGTGKVRLSGVTVRATRGIGVGIQSATEAVLSDVSLVGPVDETSAQTLDPQATNQDTATHGLVLVSVANAQIDNLTTNGFAKFGASLVDSTTTWTGGNASRNLTTGLMVSGGQVTLDGVELCGTYQGIGIIPAYGGVFTGDAVVNTNALTVCDSEGYGLLHNSVTAHHVDLVARDNRDAGVWVQFSDSFQLSGTATQLVGNRFAGVVVIDSSNIDVRDAHIDDTHVATRIVDGAGVQVGDGIQLVRTTDSVSLSNLSLTDNERVGVLLALEGGDASGVSIDNVDVSGTGDQLGVVAQDGTVPANWDSGVSRSGAVVSNDAAFSGHLDVVDLVGPTDLPSGNELTTGGLDALVGPTD